MNTPSHFLVNAALVKRWRDRAIVKSAFLFGSIAPDLPLYLLSLGSFVLYHYVQGWSLAETFRYMFDELYFNHPLWIVSHNLLHSPVVLGVGLLLLRRWCDRDPSGKSWGFWFLAGCIVHTLLDIPTHVDDGPLLFFPFNWSIRFQSPVSYWDDRYYGREFSTFEAILDVVLLLYLLWQPGRKFIRRVRQRWF